MSVLTHILEKSWASMKMPFSRVNTDKKLFTPGPLGCSRTVKEAMLRDIGSRDNEFIKAVKVIRQKILEIAEVSGEDFTTVLLQGCGTYAIEALLQTATPRIGGKVLIIVNGAYGERMKKICDVVGIPFITLDFPEDTAVDIAKVKEHLQTGETYTMVTVVHCETSSGVVNPVVEIGQTVKRHLPQAAYFVDAMSSFGAIPISIQDGNIDYIVSSANKCLQGVPGFSFVIARKLQLLNCKGNARSVSLDLIDQYEGLERNGQFRFTPPTHTLLAFLQAIREFENEGGIGGRAMRYKQNCAVLHTGMKELGFIRLLSDSCLSYIITSYLYPDHPSFNFDEFYQKLSDQGQIIYPGKLTQANCFRIGTIGNLYPSDMKHLVKCITKVLISMGVSVPIPSSTSASK